MDRRGFIVGIVLGIAMRSSVARAQQPWKTWRIGYLTPSDIPRETLLAAFGELGYVDGRNARLEVRSAQNDFGRLPALGAGWPRLATLASPPLDGSFGARALTNCPNCSTSIGVR